MVLRILGQCTMRYRHHPSEYDHLESLTAERYLAVVAFWGVFVALLAVPTVVAGFALGGLATRAAGDWAGRHSTPVRTGRRKLSSPPAVEARPA